MRSLIAVAAQLAALALAFAVYRQQPARSEGGPILVPHAVDAARVPLVSDAQVLVYNPGPGPIRLRTLRLADGDVVLYERQLDIDLAGDLAFGELEALIERLPHEISGRHGRRRFAPEDSPVLEGIAAQAGWVEATRRLESLREGWRAGEPQPLAQLDFPLPLDQVFAGSEPRGTVRVLEVRLEYDSADGTRATVRADHAVRWLGPAARGPESIGGRSVEVHAGDLHVHSCHGEAVNACPPSQDCPAESLQTSGSFSYSQLRSQYQALGLDWFTATDHSYCIDDAAEYQAIVAETAAITTSSFLCMPDTELSSDEEGPQSGGDQANALCLFATPQNHMGAHGITSRKSGGGSGFLGFCSGLDPFSANAAKIRAEGGYPIVNHPAASAFAWNSLQATQGIESGQMHGVETWNGAKQSGQGGHVATWVSWLLAGRILYSYSGSDTHDAAFAFGANHAVLIGEPFDALHLQRAVQGGRVYVSDQHALMLEVELPASTPFMGTLHALSSLSPPQAAMCKVHYDFGAATAAITVFAASPGDPSETAICQSGPLSGQGVFQCAVTVPGAAPSWVRAYSDSGGGGPTAYTNPVFFLPGAGDVATYCTAKTSSQGCAPSIGWTGLPSASLASPFEIHASSVLNNKPGILFYGFQPAAVPFQGGFLCVQPPQTRTAVQGSGGNPPPDDCSGAYRFDFRERIQAGADPSLVVGATVYAQYWYRDPASASFPTGLTNALHFTIQP
jgi:hypothetical protein